MLTVLLAIALFALAMGGLAVGWVLDGAALRGSCGGTDGDCSCARQRECPRRTAG